MHGGQREGMEGGYFGVARISVVFAGVVRKEVRRVVVQTVCRSRESFGYRASALGEMGIQKVSNSLNVSGGRMKRLFLGLIVASGLALMAAAPAGAVGPGVCGNSFGMLINGADPSTVTADGSATQPGALSHAVGVGVISFGTGTTTGCTISGGALIYNAGDVQASGAPGLYVGPAHCYDGISALGTGLPCWGGGSASEMTGSLVTPGVNGNGSY